MKRELRHLSSSRVSKNGIKREKALASLSVQALEPRVLLSGNVQALVSEGNLIIRGDAAANVIVLDQVGLEAHKVRISVASGTTINNQTDAIVMRGVTRDVNIRMGAGSDSVSLSALSLPGNVSIKGQRNLTLDNVRVAKTLNILSGATTSIINTVIDQDMMIRSVSGGGTVALQSVDVLYNTKIIGGKGSDTVTIDDSIFHGRMRLNTGSGVDLVQIERNGDPSAPPSRFHQPVSILLGNDDDTLEVGVAGESGNRAVFSNVVNFDGGAGFDDLINSDSNLFLTPSKVRIVNFESNGVAPTASITAVSPDPRNTRVDSIQIVFSEAVTGFTTADLTLTGVDLTTATLTSEDNITWTLGNLTDLTGSAGTYTLSLDMAGLTNLAGNAGVGTVSEQWVKDITAPMALIAAVSPDPRNTAVDSIQIVFSEAVTGFTTADLTLTGVDLTTATLTSADNITWTLGNLTGLTGSAGTYTLSLDMAGLTDLAGNAGGGTVSEQWVTDTTAPTVIVTGPGNNTTGVPLNQTVGVGFSEKMDPLTITTSSFTVTAPDSTLVAGTVSYVGTTATFTPTSPLAFGTMYTATITTVAKDLAGNALASNFIWTFTTAAAPDITAPTVSATNPTNNATGVPVNQNVAAIFSEAMDPLTITTSSFTVTAPDLTLVQGTVAYNGTAATFTPDSPLAMDSVYTATITTTATDLAGNALVSNFTWTFTTGETQDLIAPTVISTNPAHLKFNVALNKTVAAIFSEPMDALTITSANFTLTAPGNILVAGTVTYDALSNTATFAPSGLLDPGAMYTATILGGLSGVKDLAGNALASDFIWTFTTGTQIAQAPINLGVAGTFAVMATAAISGTGHITGDVGLSPGTAQGFPPSSITGNIFVGGTEVVAAQASLLAAYNDAVSRSTTSVDLPGNMGGKTFTPGLYTNSTSVLISGSGPGNNVTLDAQGDPNAIFIFKMGSTLTTGTSAQVILTNGAKAGNIFWVVGSSATVEANTIFKGNILAAVTITVNNGAVVEGRLFAGSGGESTGAVTINGGTVTLPLP